MPVFDNQANACIQSNLLQTESFPGTDLDQYKLSKFWQICRRNEDQIRKISMETAQAD